MSNKLVSVAIEGCCHGELDGIYSQINKLEKKPELLIICGDFQSIRNKFDLEQMAVPVKYRSLGNFHKYYNNELVAPIMTVFIGGNHEASNYLQELKYGGWVAPNIYYLGEFGVVWYKGLRISGISGIFDSKDFRKPQFEKPPYDNRSIRSIYHLRDVNYLKMHLLKNMSQRVETKENDRLDIVLTHDWPRGIYHYGDTKKLIKQKKFLASEIHSNTLGSIANEKLLHRLKPSHWFSAHLHVKFEATVNHEENGGESGEKAGGTIEPNKKIKLSNAKENSDEIDLSLNDSSSESDASELPHKTSSPINDSTKNSNFQDITKNQDELSLDLSDDDSLDDRGEVLLKGQSVKDEIEDDVARGALSSIKTEFLSLDKCLPKRQFLAVKMIEPQNSSHISFTRGGNSNFFYDKRAIAINRVIDSYEQSQLFDKRLSTSDVINIETTNENLLQELEREVNLEIQRMSNLDEAHFKIPENFAPTAPGHGQSEQGATLKEYVNPQTVWYKDKYLLSK